MRQAIKRFTRLTLGYSKKLDNLKAACALDFPHLQLLLDTLQFARHACCGSRDYRSCLDSERTAFSLEIDIRFLHNIQQVVQSNEQFLKLLAHIWAASDPIKLNIWLHFGA
jgi:hypothetical protein